MVKLTHKNLTDHKYYEYNIDGVTAENDCYYHCSECFTNFYIIAYINYCVITNTVGSISFTSKNGDAKITLNNITIQAFSLDGDKLSSRS